jgi:hypothetical protein
VFWRGNAYNGRRSDELLRPGGLRSGSVFAQREGIVTRGVLLDVTAVRGVQYLTPGDAVTADDLTAAERLSGTTVTTGDAVFVHVGLERREAEQGTEDPAVRAGLDASCLPWLHEREVAVYSGDCIEQIPFPSEASRCPSTRSASWRWGLCYWTVRASPSWSRRASSWGRRSSCSPRLPFASPVPPDHR